MRTLITGATGLIGWHLVHRLDDVVVLTRDPERARKRLSGITAFKWDPLGGPPPLEAFEGVDVVVNLAGEPIADSRWTPERKRAIRDSRVIGTKNLVAGLAELRRRPSVLISGSAVGWYGDRGNEPLFESSNPGKGFLADVCRDWESAAFKASDYGIRVVRLRTGVVLSDIGGAMERILKPFHFGLGGRIGNGLQWMPWVHVNDVTGLIIHAATQTDVKGPVNVVGPQPATNREFTRIVAVTLGRPAFLNVPVAWLRLAMGEMSEVLTASQRVIPEVAERTGYRFEYPALETAVRASLKSSRTD